jgi:hypothetical protein
VKTATSNDPADVAELEAALIAIQTQPQGVSATNMLTRLEASAPNGGFMTTNAIRLVHTYGLATRVNPVLLAFHFSRKVKDSDRI